MMLVPFGFSIGDFITGIGAFKTVCVALKEQGGAVTEYKEVSEELDRIQDIVQKVNSVSDHTSPNSEKVTNLSNNLAEQAEAYLKLITRFTERLNRYDPILGAKGPQSHIRAIWSKADWALYFSSELRKVRQVMECYSSNITLSFCHLLYLRSLESEELSVRQQEQLQKSVQNNLSAASEKLDSNHAVLGRQNAVVLQGLNDLAAKMRILETQQLDNYDNLKREMALVSTDTFKWLSELNSKLDNLGERHSEQLRTEPLIMGDEVNGRQLTEEELHYALRARARKIRLKLHWDSSIVDLMKLLDLEAGLFARKLLSHALDVHVGPVGSADQNIALHKALLRVLAQNGGMVPGSIYDLIHL